MNGGDATDRARELAHEGRFKLLTRLGFFSRGALYILIALLVLRTGRTEDLAGAMAYLNDGSGQLLLGAIGAGMLAYGLWRLADAISGMETRGNGRKAMIKRAAAAVSGSIYLYLAYKAARLLSGGGESGGLDGSARQQADIVLDLPGGSFVLGIAALILVVAGLYQLRTAIQCSFLDQLDHRAQLEAVRWLGRIGYAARGIIFLTVALMIGKAALDGSSREAGGMEQALDFFSGPVLYAVALGLMLFGAFSIIEALFRKIHEPPVDEMKRDLQEKLGT